MSRRERKVEVLVNDSELALLDEHRPDKMSRAAYVRSLIRKPQGDLDVASRAEVLALLTEAARGGSVTAQVALERALREAGEAANLDPWEAFGIEKPKR